MANHHNKRNHEKPFTNSQLMGVSSPRKPLVTILRLKMESLAWWTKSSDWMWLVDLSAGYTWLVMVDKRGMMTTNNQQFVVHNMGVYGRIHGWLVMFGQQWLVMLRNCQDNGWLVIDWIANVTGHIGSTTYRPGAAISRPPWNVGDSGIVDHPYMVFLTANIEQPINHGWLSW